MDWADVAKAISIIGVVLLHAILVVPGGEDTYLRAFYLLLDPIRMPLFFMISGLFSHRVVSRNLTEQFNTFTIGGNYPFVLTRLPDVRRVHPVRHRR